MCSVRAELWRHFLADQQDRQSTRRFEVQDCALIGCPSLRRSETGPSCTANLRHKSWRVIRCRQWIEPTEACPRVSIVQYLEHRIEGRAPSRAFHSNDPNFLQMFGEMHGAITLDYRINF